MLRRRSGVFSLVAFVLTVSQSSSLVSTSAGRGRKAHWGERRPSLRPTTSAAASGASDASSSPTPLTPTELRIVELRAARAAAVRDVDLAIAQLEREVLEEQLQEQDDGSAIPHFDYNYG